MLFLKPWDLFELRFYLKPYIWTRWKLNSCGWMRAGALQPMALSTQGPCHRYRKPRPWGGGRSMHHSLRTQAGWKPRLVPSRPLLKWHLLVDSFPDGLSKIYPLTSNFILRHHIISYYLGINILRHINFYFYIIGAYYMTNDWMTVCFLILHHLHDYRGLEKQLLSDV